MIKIDGIEFTVAEVKEAIASQARLVEQCRRHILLDLFKEQNIKNLPEKSKRLIELQDALDRHQGNF